jgi:hypothetical protein
LTNTHAKGWARSETIAIIAHNFDVAKRPKFAPISAGRVAFCALLCNRFGIVMNSLAGAGDQGHSANKTFSSIAEIP